MKNLVEKYHLSKAVAMQVMNLLKNNAMLRFWEITKRRKKQVLLDQFLVAVVWKEKDTTEPIDSNDTVSDN